jgi:hypothetical protein
MRIIVFITLFIALTGCAPAFIDESSSAEDATSSADETSSSNVSTEDPSSPSPFVGARVNTLESGSVPPDPACTEHRDDYPDSCAFNRELLFCEDGLRTTPAKWQCYAFTCPYGISDHACFCCDNY